jgi:Amt family ammonium transporter
MLLMLAGWVPYVLGAAALNGGFGPKTPMNVLLAAAAGTLAAVVFGQIRYGKVDVMLTYGGLLGGLVAITAAGGAVHSIWAVVIGAVAGVIVPVATVTIDLVWKLDDPGGGVAAHAVGGAWGTLAVGLFAPSAGVPDKLQHLGVQLLGLSMIGAISFGASFIAFLALKRTVGLRLGEDAEYDGADLAEHDLNAYPDFQQTMIKSYHLREA